MGSQSLLPRRSRATAAHHRRPRDGPSAWCAAAVGHKNSEVFKRVDVFAAALYHGMQVEELNDLDLSYTPPLSTPWDPIQIGAQAWNKALREDSTRSFIPA